MNRTDALFLKLAMLHAEQKVRRLGASRHPSSTSS